MSAQSRTHSRLVSVHRTRRPCPVCGHRDNCAVSDSGTYCRRVSSQYPGRDGGWWHPRDETIQIITSALPIPKPATQRATPAHLHNVYSALLSLLTLSTKHKDDLLARGLPQPEIERLGSKSTPTAEEGKRIARALSKMGLTGVPGFNRSDGEWKMVKCLPGFFVPYVDSQSRIWGLMYRLDVPVERQKYRWLSSAGFSQGTSSGAPLHFARPELLPKAREVWLTEGALKADIASFYLDVAFIAAGGVTQWGQHFAEHFKARFPHIERLIIAYDRDWRTNQHVRAALERLIEQLKDARLRFVIRTWAEDAKGIDDLCLVLSESTRKGAQVAA